jgi:hypothetical protein
MAGKRFILGFILGVASQKQAPIKAALQRLEMCVERMYADL